MSTLFLFGLRAKRVLFDYYATTIGGSVEPDNTSERALIEAARDGDLDAQTKLYELCADDLVRFIDRQMGAKLKRHESAEDLRQLAFAKALKALPVLEEGADLSAFRGLLFQNAKWILMQQGNRAQGFVGESHVGVGQPAELADQGFLASTGIVTKADEKARLHAWIAELEEKYQEIVRLRLEGQEFSEIAEGLDLTLECVRKRFQRASTELAQKAEAERRKRDA